MSNDTFQELYDKLIDDNIKLRNTGIDDLSVWSVDYNGYGGDCSNRNSTSVGVDHQHW